MQKDYDVIIIGGGPAGLTAAIYALRAGLSVALFEKKFIGGQAAITSDIENYPGFAHVNGEELTRLMHEQAEKHGLVTVRREVKEISKLSDGMLCVKTKKQEYGCLALIYAAGASARKLGIEEGFEGVGVSYCATCDGNFFKGKTVAVVGGGNTALGDALYLSKLAEKVYVIHRRNEFRAKQVLVERAQATENISLVMNAVPVEIKGVAGERVEGLTIENTLTKERTSLPVEGIFMAVGQKPVSALLEDVAELDVNGYVVTDTLMRTNVPGLFAAGDVRNTALRQVITACADGALAAEQAAEFISTL